MLNEKMELAWLIFLTFIVIDCFNSFKKILFFSISESSVNLKRCVPDFTHLRAWRQIRRLHQMILEKKGMFLSFGKKHAFFNLDFTTFSRPGLTKLYGAEAVFSASFSRT